MAKVALTIPRCRVREVIAVVLMVWATAACHSDAARTDASSGMENGRVRWDTMLAVRAEDAVGTVIVMNHGRGDDSISEDIFDTLLREIGVLGEKPTAD